MQRTNADVVILGAGPAGVATALAIRSSSELSVLLVDRGVLGRQKIGETLAPMCRPLLERLGVWERFLAAGHRPAHGSCSAWGRDELLFRDYVFQPQGAGWHLDRNRFDEDLVAEAITRGVGLLRPVTLLEGSRARPTGEMALGWKLLLRRGVEEYQEVAARFVVDASGRSAAFARRRGARRMFQDRLVGHWAVLPASESQPFRDLTLIECAEEGWWYSAVVPGSRQVVLHITDSDLAREQGLRDPERWLAHSRQTRYLAKRLEGTRADGIETVSAASHRLDASVGKGWLAVGDAAASHDPLSAQGISKALQGGLWAAEVVRDSLAGSSEKAAAYQRWLYEDFARYLEIRGLYYRMESRWPRSRFWSRRQGTFAPYLPADATNPAARRGARGSGNDRVPATARSGGR